MCWPLGVWGMSSANPVPLSFLVDETARPNPFGMPGIVPPYVPPQMLNIPQTPLQAKPVVRPSSPSRSWSACLGGCCIHIRF